MSKKTWVRDIAIVIILIAIPVTISLNRQPQDQKGRAAAPDQLETEGGVLGGNALAKTDQTASGGQYVLFPANQTPTNTPTPIPSSTGIYGPALASDSLNNTRIGADYGYRDDYRFRAKHTGSLVSFRPYVIFSSTKRGYSAGTGGTIKFELRTDDGTSNHAPSNTVLATAIHSNPLNKGSFPLISFSSAANITEGQIYHLTVTNIDPDPVTNFVSMDHLFLYNASSTQMQPKYNDLDWAEMITYSGGTWTLRRENTPILALYFSDGFTFGMGYMEVWVGAPMPISGLASVREKITVTGGNRTVSELNIRLKRSSGSDPLSIKIQKSDGTIVEQGTIASNSVPISYNWVKYTFSSAKTLVSGQTYYLILNAPSGSVYEAYPIRQGKSYGYPASTYFSDGVAEYTSDAATWYGWKQWGVNDRKEQDLQFYFK